MVQTGERQQANGRTDATKCIISPASQSIIRLTTKAVTILTLPDMEILWFLGVYSFIWLFFCICQVLLLTTSGCKICNSESANWQDEQTDGEMLLKVLWRLKVKCSSRREQTNRWSSRHNSLSWCEKQMFLLSETSEHSWRQVNSKDTCPRGKFHKITSNDLISCLYTCGQVWKCSNKQVFGLPVLAHAQTEIFRNFEPCRQGCWWIPAAVLSTGCVDTSCTDTSRSDLKVADHNTANFFH